MIKELESIMDEFEDIGTDSEATDTDRETLEEDFDDAALQKEKINVGTEGCHNLAKDRECLIIEAQQMGKDREATETDLETSEDFDDAPLEEWQFNIIRQDCDNIVKELESLMEATDTDIETSEEDIDDALLEEWQLNNTRLDCDNIVKESVKDELGDRGTDREATETDIDDADILEEHLYFAGEDFDDIEKGKDILVLEDRYVKKDRGAIDEELVDAALHVEQLGGVREECSIFANERNP
jgi:Holliday junction resolvase RusA-like endonuclease